MKILCKTAFSQSTGKDLSNSETFWLTAGKEYVVLAMSLSTLRCLSMLIVKDDGETVLVRMAGFEFLSRKVPASWVKRYHKATNPLFDEEWFLPKSWDYDEFFDELEDWKPRALNLVHEEAKKIYAEEGLEYEIKFF